MTPRETLTKHGFTPEHLGGNNVALTRHHADGAVDVISTNIGDLYPDDASPLTCCTCYPNDEGETADYWETEFTLAQIADSLDASPDASGYIDAVMFRKDAK